MEMWAAEKDLYIESPFNAGAGHYGALISPSNTCYGFASVGGMCAGEITPYQVGSTNATNMDGAYEITVGLPSSAVSADALTPSATSVGVGKSVDVAATLSYSGISFTLDATLTTEDPSIAKVSGCTVTGVKAGSTTLTMTAGGATKSFTFTVGAVQMHRLYNQWTGEHFYTANTHERDELVKVGWTSEGVGWVAPESSSTPVYRLYNPYVMGGDHHYTTNASERDAPDRGRLELRGRGLVLRRRRGRAALPAVQPVRKDGHPQLHGRQERERHPGEARLERRGHRLVRGEVALSV